MAKSAIGLAACLRCYCCCCCMSIVPAFCLVLGRVIACIHSSMTTPTTRLRTSRGASSTTSSTSSTVAPSAPDRKQPSTPRVHAYKGSSAAASSSSAAASSFRPLRFPSPPAEMRRLAIKQPLPASSITSASTPGCRSRSLHTSAASHCRSLLRCPAGHHAASRCSDRPASTLSTVTPASLLRPTRSAASVTVHPARPQLQSAPSPSSSASTRLPPPSLPAVLPPGSSLSSLPAPAPASEAPTSTCRCSRCCCGFRLPAPVSSLSALLPPSTPSPAASSSPPSSTPSHSRRLSVEDNGGDDCSTANAEAEGRAEAQRVRLLLTAALLCCLSNLSVLAHLPHRPPTLAPPPHSRLQPPSLRLPLPLQQPLCPPPR